MLFVYDRLRLIKKSIDAMGNFSSCAAGGFKVRRSSSVRSSFSSACSSPSSSSRDRAPWPAQYTAAADGYAAEHSNGGGGAGSAAAQLAMEKLAQGGAGGGRRGTGAMGVVRVLLVDGSVLQFRQPVKVIRLLLDYPHHFICHLDSRHLRPGHHSTLSSLLPDEELQLGHLYLLLPFHAASQRRHPAPASATCRDQQQPQQPYPHHSQDTSSSNHHTRSKHGASTSDKARLLASPRSEPPRRSASCSTRSSSTAAAYHYQPLRSSAKRDKGGATSKNYSSPCTSPPPASSASCSRASTSSTSSSSSMMDRADKLGQLAPRLCDTPELQRAYRSVMLRRCRSWTPRLQAINELGRR